MPETPFNRLRILLVEDLPLHRKLIPLRLGPLGRETASVPSAEEAEGFLAHHVPDLVLLDVVMPQKDGFTFCRELKADLRTRFISVVMLTDLNADAHDRSIEAGADDYLPKRVDDAVLRVRVNLHLRLQEMRMQDVGRTWDPSPLTIALVTKSPSLQHQLPAQFALDHHVTRLHKDLAEVDRPGTDLLVVDAGSEAATLPEALQAFRADPVGARIPAVLLCERLELAFLPLLESLVDDVLWKPLNARVTRFRLRLLQEFAVRGRSVQGAEP